MYLHPPSFRRDEKERPRVQGHAHEIGSLMPYRRRMLPYTRPPNVDPPSGSVSYKSNMMGVPKSRQKYPWCKLCRVQNLPRSNLRLPRSSWTPCPRDSTRREKLSSATRKLAGTSISKHEEDSQRPPRARCLISTLTVKRERTTCIRSDNMWAANDIYIGQFATLDGGSNRVAWRVTSCLNYRRLLSIDTTEARLCQ